MMIGELPSYFTQKQTAAGAHPFFDDELPKVFPPFLPPLSPEE